MSPLDKVLPIYIQGGTQKTTLYCHFSYNQSVLRSKVETDNSKCLLQISFFFLISHYWFKLCCTVFVGIGTLTWYRLCVCKVKQRCLHSSFINQNASMSFIFYEGLGMTALYGGKNPVCYIESLTLIEQLIRH